MGRNKGFKCSDETKRKMSLAKIGKHRSLEFRNLISQSNKNRKVSMETRKKMSIKGKMRKPTLETRNKIKLANLGNKSHFWKDGISKENKIIRNSLEMRLWRESIFKRDNYKCQLQYVGCSKKNSNKLEANHIKLFSTHPKLRFEISNGITLCKDCHKEIRNREWRFESLFNLILNHNKWTIQ